MKRFPFKDGERVLFQGDSITDAGRRNDRHGMGSGYVAMVKGFLSAASPVRVEVINRGVSGDTTTDLLNRWEQDVIELKPKYLSVMIGVNDVARQFRACEDPPVLHDQYKVNYRELIETALEAGVKRLVLMTPTSVDGDPQSEGNRMIEEYANTVAAFAREFDAILVPSREKLWLAAQQGPSVDFWMPDGVHPSPAGHAVLAAAWLEAVGVI